MSGGVKATGQRGGEANETKRRSREGEGEREGSKRSALASNSSMREELLADRGGQRPFGQRGGDTEEYRLAREDERECVAKEEWRESETAGEGVLRAMLKSEPRRPGEPPDREVKGSSGATNGSSADSDPDGSMASFIGGEESAETGSEKSAETGSEGVNTGG